MKKIERKKHDGSKHVDHDDDAFWEDDDGVMDANEKTVNWRLPISEHLTSVFRSKTIVSFVRSKTSSSIFLSFKRKEWGGRSE